MFDFIVCAVSNLFRIYLIYRFAEVFAGKKLKEKHKAFWVYLSFFAVNTLLFWKFHTAWINITCNLVGIGAVVWLYTKSIKTNLFVTSTICLVNMGCDVAATLLFIRYQDGQVHSQIYATAAVFLIFICELLSEKIITNRKDMEKAPTSSLIDNQSKELDMCEHREYRRRSRLILAAEGIIYVLAIYFRWKLVLRSMGIAFFIVSLSLLMGVIKSPKRNGFGSKIF